jgi:DNA-binding transcriptional LysR family regulator
LIPILQSLLNQESVVKAAEELSLTQSTVSGALAKLRDMFDDPLLVRVGRHSQLTPRAQKLKDQVDSVCSHMEQLFEIEKFDPAKSEEHFWIAAPDYLVFILNRVLLTRLHVEAPKIKIHFVNVPTNLPETMANRSVDLAVCADFGLWPELQKEVLFEDKTVAAVCLDHPLLQREHVTLDDLLEFPSLYYDPRLLVSLNKSFDPPPIDQAILNWDPHMQVSSGQVIESLLIASETNSIARVQQSLFNIMKKNLSITLVDLPDESSLFDTVIMSLPDQERTAEIDWLRSIVRDAVAELKN